MCEKWLAGNPDNIILFSDRPDLLRQHFLEVRRLEADNIEESPKAHEVAALQDTYNKYHDSIRELPNPDAVISKGRMDGLNYLREWAESFAK